MTGMGDGTYIMSRVQRFEPEWIRRERYDYCADFRETLKGRKGSSFFGRLARMFSAFFL